MMFMMGRSINGLFLMSEKHKKKKKKKKKSFSEKTLLRNNKHFELRQKDVRK